jgi:hypothetical protein
LKAIAWEDAKGTVWLAYNNPEYPRHRYVLDDLTKKTTGTSAWLQETTE